jgi:hypothetical protein
MVLLTHEGVADRRSIGVVVSDVANAVTLSLLCVEPA